MNKRIGIVNVNLQYEIPDTIPEEEEIDYFSEALTLYQNGSYLQAKIMFEQAKRVFNEDQDIDSATVCEGYILRCDQYFQATQLYQQAEDFYAQEDFITALTYYQQAQSVYQLLEDDRASLCEERILEIREKQSKQGEPPYYLILLVPVAAAVIAAIWLIKRKPPPPLPDYVPEKKIGKEKPKRLFEEVEGEREGEGEIGGEKPEILEKLEKIESALDTENIHTFKSLVRDFKKQEIRFDKEEYTPKEAAYTERSLESVREKIKEKGKRLQDTKKLEDLREEVDALLNEPVGDLIDAYNKYARLHNVFDQIPDLQIQEQEDLKTKLKEYYEFIQQQAKSEQSQMQ